MRLHLGCGQNIIPGWLNLDIEPGRGGIKCDLTAPLPYKDNSVDFVFNEHFLEHLTRDQGWRFLCECYRVLRVGGVLRISTPDLSKLIGDYVNDEVISIPGIWEPKTAGQMVNEGMRLWGHQYVYDRKDLVVALGASGFEYSSLNFHSYRDSSYEELLAIEHRPFMGELICEAVK